MDCELDLLKRKLERNLFPVEGVLAKRYNRALESMLNQHNTLERFTIDRRGKSPEVAGLLGDGYLDVGEANRFMIILSPDQAAAPFIDEICSFDNEVMDALYSRAARTIADITRHEPLVGELDDHVQEYYTPDDLLLLDTVEITLDTPEKTVSQIMKLKKMSRELGEGMNLLDEAYIDEMRDLVRAVGDIRRRSVSAEIFPIQVEIGSFYVALFGGYFFFRNINAQSGPDTLVVSCGAGRGRKSLREIQVTLQSPALLQRLHDCGLIQYNRDLIDWRLKELEDEALLDEGFDVVEMSAVDRKRGLRKATPRLGELYRSLLDVKKILRVDKNANLGDFIKRKSRELRLCLAEPARDANVVQRLLSKLVPHNYETRFVFEYKELKSTIARMDPLRKKYVHSRIEQYVSRNGSAPFSGAGTRIS